MSAKTVCSGSPNPSRKLVVENPAENNVPAEFVTEEAAARRPAAKESKNKRSCCMRICDFLTSCCRRNPTSVSQENNNSEENRPKNPKPTNELRFLTDKTECATDVGDGSRDTKKKRIFRRIFPCCSTSKLPKQKNYEAATSSAPIMEVAILELPTICVSSEDQIEVDSQSSIEKIEIIEENRNAPENSQEIEHASDEEAGLDQKPEKIDPVPEETKIDPVPEETKIDPVPEETKIDTETTPKFQLEDEKDEEREVYGLPKDGKFFSHLIDIEETRLKNRMTLASGRMENLEDECEETGKIRVAIGKGNLLISKKFKQFRELCQTNVEQNAGAPIPESDAGPTLNEDLEGFWELLLMQVQIIDDLLDKTEETSLPKVQDPVQKKQTRKPTMTQQQSRPKPAAKSKIASDRDEARRKMLAERRAAMKKLPEQSSNPVPEEHEMEKEIQEDILTPNLEILDVDHNVNQAEDSTTIVQAPGQVFTEDSESLPPDQLNNQQFTGKYFEEEIEVEIEAYFSREFDKLEKLLDSTTPDAAKEDIIESILEELEELQKNFRPVIDSAGENAQSLEENDGQIEALVNAEFAEAPLPSDIIQDESRVDATQTRLLQDNSEGQESKNDGANNFGSSEPEHESSEELQKYFEQELDQIEEKLNVISSGGIGSNSQGEIESVLQKLDELEAEFRSQIGETRFAALHHLCAPKDHIL